MIFGVNGAVRKNDKPNYFEKRNKSEAFLDLEPPKENMLVEANPHPSRSVINARRTLSNIVCPIVFVGGKSKSIGSVMSLNNFDDPIVEMSEESELKKRR